VCGAHDNFVSYTWRLCGTCRLRDNPRIERVEHAAHNVMSHSRLIYHFVFATKDRVPLISERWENELYAYLAGIVKNHKGQAIIINGMPDHVHLLIILEPCDLPAFMRELKASSSRGRNSINRTSHGSVDTGHLPSANQLSKPFAITFTVKRNIIRSGRSSRSMPLFCGITMSRLMSNICGADRVTHAPHTWLSGPVIYTFRKACTCSYCNGRVLRTLSSILASQFAGFPRTIIRILERQKCQTTKTQDCFTILRADSSGSDIRYSIFDAGYSGRRTSDRRTNSRLAFDSSMSSATRWRMRST
jgi:REP element-mobilizing transposase RayT